MKRYLLIIFLLIVCLTMWGKTDTQQGISDQASVKFSQPDKTGLVKVRLMSGGVTVEGYNGKLVLVEAKIRGKILKRSKKNTKGLRSIKNVNTGLVIEEENNIISIRASSFDVASDLSIRVPFATSLKINCYNDGKIKITNVTGELELNNLNGSIIMTGVSGTVIAKTLNGDVKVKLKNVNPEKPMSFSTMNGDVDVSFPRNINNNILMKTTFGDIYTDFEIKINKRAQKKVEDNRKAGGKYRISFNQGISGKINNGGPELKFTSHNGDIFVRKSE